LFEDFPLVKKKFKKIEKRQWSVRIIRPNVAGPIVLFYGPANTLSGTPQRKKEEEEEEEEEEKAGKGTTRQQQRPPP